MEELDLTYYGVRIHLVAAAETTLCSRLRETIPLEDPMPAGSEPASVSYTVTAGASLDMEEQSGYIISRDGSEVVSKATEEEVVEWLWQDIDCTIAVHNRRLLFVQAGVVGWHGVAIVIPGPRQAAKSALVAELVQRGAVYYSDTFAVLDEAGQVHAYARPLLLESERCEPSDLRPAREEAPAEPVPVGLIVAGAYRPGCTWRPAIVQGARALWSLFEHTVPLEAQAQWAQRSPTEYLIHIAGRVVPTVVTLQGPWAQAEDIAARLLNLVDDSLVSHASAASSNSARSLSEDLVRVAELRVGTVSPQPVPASRPGPVAKRLVAIVTPIHRLPLSADEQISLRHLRTYLGHYDRFLIGPLSPPTELADFAVPTYTARYFADRIGYSRLLVAEEFYRAFASYEYILIYQPDCLVFSDQLEAWCRQGWDYVGAPWFNRWTDPQYTSLENPADPVDRFGDVGNGGFSLRKVDSALAVLNSSKQPLRDALLGQFLNDPRSLEDHFWSFDAPDLVDGFRIPRPRQALAFAFETEPRYCFHENAGRLPFGCHSWARLGRDFWEPYLLK